MCTPVCMAWDCGSNVTRSKRAIDLSSENYMQELNDEISRLKLCLRLSVGFGTVIISTFTVSVCMILYQR